MSGAEADSSVKAGATWIARSLNTVAANNTEMARSVAVINILNGYPQANEFTLIETIALQERLNEQLPLTGTPAVLYSFLNAELIVMVDEMALQIDDLEIPNAFFDSIEFKNY